MRNILALIGLVIVVFVGVGYARGWYSFNATPGLDGKKHIAVDVDTKKIKNDGEQAVDKVGEVAENLKSKNAGSATEAPATVPVPPK